MPTLQEKLLAPDIRPHVIADCQDLVEREVAEMSGITGTAVKLAYKTVRTFDAGHIPAMIESILPSVAEALQPYWASFAAEFPGGGDFGGYLGGREDEVAEALLAITDRRRRASSRATIVKAYNTVRGSAAKHVKAALPALGALVQKYMGALLVSGRIRTFAYVSQVPGFPMMRRGSLGGVVTRSGLILDDRYRLDERIAAGGVGQVWRATDLLLERAVAVKVLRPEYADHPETIERFRKEAKNAGALSNSHVAQVYDYAPSGPDGSPYLVMEYVDGPSLADLLAVDPIEPAKALDVIAQAADGLAAAHKAGVIHRDIKPGNILISSEGRVKVTDFGIAHAAGQVPVTAPGLVMGTTQYMAPERIAGNPGTAASDLYALGIVLHECLTGMPPHDGTAAEVMAAHLYLPLPPLPADVPAELDVLVDRLTTKDPARRISDARELADLAARLRDAIGGGPLVPPARGAAQSGPGAAVPGPVSHGAAVGAAHGDGQDGAVDTGGTEPTGNTGGGVSTELLAAPGGYGHAYVSDEWEVPPRMSRPTGPPGPGQPGRPPQGNPRRRAGAAVAVGAVAVAGAGLVALLVSGAFAGSPTANQAPAGSSTTGAPSTAGGSSHTAPGTVRTTGPAGGVAPSTAATPVVTSPKATPGGKRSTSPSAHPSTGAPTSSTPGGGASGTPSGTPSGAPSTSPTGSPGSSPSGAPSPSPSSCFLGICL
jgi:serine/threonine-protein kinase